MGKWYNKIFIGNPNKEDFTSKDLPKTRVEQFFDVVKLRFSGMVTGNLLYALFALPLVLWGLYYWFAVVQLEKEIALDQLFGEGSTVLSFLSLCVPLYVITGPAKAGLYYCIRNWIWNERAAVSEHFWKEFKRSWKQALVLNFISAGLLYSGLWWMLFCYLNASQFPILKFIAIFVGFILVLYFMSSIYHFPQLVTYKLKVSQILKNSLIYLAVQFPRTLIACIIYVALIALCVVLSQVLLVVALTLGVSFVFLAQMILSDFLFDKYVNKPEERRKGMAPLE
ncbi:MAG: DUF624 domain-containing protein [Clostridia bacterium]|nr:DUF624 domain-containing protein [Clostridia bacterium]